MRRHWRKTLKSAVVAVGGGTLLVTGAETACISLSSEQALASTDFCFLFDCQQGAIGGLVDFCSQSILEEELFTDCPQFTDDTNP